MRSPIEEKILSEIRPKRQDRDHVHAIADCLVKAVDRSGIAEGMVVGSIARDTWLAGDRDLDVFLLFDPALSREELEEKGLSLARSIAGTYADRFHEKYAEHPYINAQIESLDVDLVPCYRVPSPHVIQSAVDRTPFHTRYISERIDPFVDDVLLFKQFAKTGGFYGSDQMTEGFAGYLCELLIYHYRGFLPLLQAASDWKKYTFIDIEGIAGKEFKDPLVVIDPVDPNRNVAASVSLTRKFEFVEMARGYLQAPSEWFFRPKEENPLLPDEYHQLLSERGTTLYAVVFRTPPLIPDIVVPQLRKSLAALQGLLERNGFVVNRADCHMGEEECMILFELLVGELPRVQRHMGPPIWEGKNAGQFFTKQRPALCTGPFIEEGGYVVEIPRHHTRAATLLSSQEILSTALGKHVKQSLQSGWTVREQETCWRENVAPFLGRFLRRCSPLASIRKREQEE
jgi:tRNA nucleotidyltransferase (CCA-adding enzyme)